MVLFQKKYIATALFIIELRGGWRDQSRSCTGGHANCCTRGRSSHIDYALVDKPPVAPGSNQWQSRTVKSRWFTQGPPGCQPPRSIGTVGLGFKDWISGIPFLILFLKKYSAIPRVGNLFNSVNIWSALIQSRTLFIAVERGSSLVNIVHMSLSAVHGDRSC